MPFDNIPGHDPRGPYWQGFAWSHWYRLDELCGPLKQVRLRVDPEDKDKGFETDKALYRIRLGRRRGLVYIGETSASARTRLRTHYQGIRAARGLNKYPQHGPLGWYKGLALPRNANLVIWASWTPVPNLGKSDRRGVEAELIAAYRAIMGKNPDYQWPGEDSDDEEGEW
jgi:hypothetical protein